MVWYGLLINLLTLGAVSWYAFVAGQQRDAMIRQNGLTRQALSATEGAVFQIFADYNQVLHNPWIGVNCRNVGHAPARSITGTVEYSRLGIDGHIIQHEVRDISDNNTVTPTLAITAKFALTPVEDLSAYRNETFRVKVAISYDDGFTQKQSQGACFEMVISPNSPTLAPIDCRDAKDWKEHPPN